MFTLPPPAVDASTRLLRVLASLAAQLDPVKGIKASTLRGFAEDIEDIRKEHGESLSSEVRQPLATAVSCLSSFADATVPYADCLPAHTALSQALPLLLVPLRPPSPPRLSPFLRLPTEVVARIVDFCQDDDLRLRQNTNLALSRTCRLFHRAVSPILDGEMCVFTTGQLDRLAVVVAAQELNNDVGYDPTVPVRLSVQIDPKSLSQLGGESLGSTLLRLAKSFQADVLNGGLRRRVVSGSLPAFEDLHHLVGMSGDDFCDFVLYDWPSSTTLTLPVCGANEDYGISVVDALLRTPCTSVYLGAAAVPYEIAAVDIDLAIDRHVGFDDDITLSHLVVLAAPYLRFPPSDFLDFISHAAPNFDIDSQPVPCDPALQHLEIAFNLDHAATYPDQLPAIFTFLAPTLCHLSLRLRDRFVMTEKKASIVQQLVDALKLCTNLVHLELGGHGLDQDDIFSVATSLSRLHHLTPLPLPHSFYFPGLPHSFHTLPPSLRSLVVCVPANLNLDKEGQDEKSPLNQCLEVCDARGVELRFEQRVAEERWLDRTLFL
ncbi:hypothetical protein JCM8097_008814 [Rhodosporidiobolus ruineniae]